MVYKQQWKSTDFSTLEKVINMFEKVLLTNTNRSQSHPKHQPYNRLSKIEGLMLCHVRSAMMLLSLPQRIVMSTDCVSSVSHQVIPDVSAQSGKLTGLYTREVSTDQIDNLPIFDRQDYESIYEQYNPSVFPNKTTVFQGIQ